jgi:hypothetical protein
MAFNRSAFAPIGGQSSRGGAPQVYSYKHPTDTVTDNAELMATSMELELT